MPDEPTQREIDQDIEIDLQMVWNDPPIGLRFNDGPETPYQKYHRQMREKLAVADDAERITLEMELRRVGELERKALRAGVFPHLVGTDRDPRIHCHTSKAPEVVLPYVPHGAGHDDTPAQSASAAMSAAGQHVMGQRLAAYYARNRGGF